MELIELRVAGYLDDLHPILKRQRYRMKTVGGRYEHDLGEVVLEINVMVDECRVLLRVQDL